MPELQTAWKDISNEMFSKYILTMKFRCRAVIKRKVVTPYFNKGVGPNSNLDLLSQTIKTCEFTQYLISIYGNNISVYKWNYFL